MNILSILLLKRSGNSLHFISQSSQRMLERNRRRAAIELFTGALKAEGCPVFFKKQDKFAPFGSLCSLAKRARDAVLLSNQLFARFNNPV
ncbi:MAG: hypothetical protein CVU57_08190 [Deltaproteobacteria bacterium HGW-Deltaproteobacteria-15]|nr:MAG: hypothetical protein CVU57_08190 [Deltaproteobacteria bacterium HGW-Deltaproteobacteria-15]